MPSRMMPIYPSEGSFNKEIEFAHHLFEMDARLSFSLPEDTARAIVDVFDAVSARHSSLIEGYQATPEEFLRPSFGPEHRDVVITRCLFDAIQKLRKARIGFGYRAYETSTIKLAHSLFYSPLNAALDPSTQDYEPQAPGVFRDKIVQVGKHITVESEVVPALLAKLQDHKPMNKAARLVSAFSLHHRLCWIHPFLDGNGRISRMILQMALEELGIGSLWSAARGISRHVEDYYVALANADQRRRGDMDGRGNLSNKSLVDFVSKMMQICEEEIEHSLQSLNRNHLTKCIDDYFTEGLAKDFGVTLHSHLPWKALFFQGKMTRGEFKSLIPKGDRTATAQVAALAKAGLVVTKTTRSDLVPRIPMALARKIFAEL